MRRTYIILRMRVHNNVRGSGLSIVYYMDDDRGSRERTPPGHSGRSTRFLPGGTTTALI